MYQYSFTSTADDLLDAEEADRTSHWGRAPVRLFIIILGISWLILGIVTFDLGNIKSIGISIVWLIIGAMVIHFFIVKPMVTRLKIKKSIRNEKVNLEFEDDQIIINTDSEKFVRNYDELVCFVAAKKGIAFYYDDGTINWLPNRVFKNKAERNSFIGFLPKKY